MEIDVRGPRFSAAVACTVLVLAYLTRQPTLLAVQVVVFAVGSIAGLRWSPYGNVFRFLKRRLPLGPPPATEPEGGPRFAQTMGLLVSGTGLGLVLLGQATFGWALVLVVIALSALLALTGLCVACELRAVALRLTRARA
jgi:Domain of unknown function (DUF4395)